MEDQARSAEGNGHKKGKKHKKSAGHEDIIDGFAFVAYKNFDDLQRAIKAAEERSRACANKLRKSVSTATNTSPLLHKISKQPLRPLALPQMNGETTHSKKKKIKRERDDNRHPSPTPPAKVSRHPGSPPLPPPPPPPPPPAASLEQLENANAANDNSPPPEPEPKTSSQPSAQVPEEPQPRISNGHGSLSNKSLDTSSPAPSSAPKSFFAPYAPNAVTRLAPNGTQEKDKETEKQPAKSTTTKAFGSIARLLDEDSNRAHSPRGHSPSRERESYSSGVSSLSGAAVTPTASAPLNLSPQLSYAKTASWLSSVPPPRPTPPPPAPGPPPPPPHSLGYVSPLYGSPLLAAPSHADALLHHAMSALSPQGELLRRDFLNQALAMGQRPTMGLRPPSLSPHLLSPRMDLYRGYPYATPPPMGLTPFAAPQPQQSPYGVPPTPKRSGRWNALHVRIAWEIYHHLSKERKLKPSPLPEPQPQTEQQRFPPPPFFLPPAPPSLPHRNLFDPWSRLGWPEYPPPRPPSPSRNGMGVEEDKSERPHSSRAHGYPLVPPPPGAGDPYRLSLLELGNYHRPSTSSTSQLQQPQSQPHP